MSDEETPEVEPVRPGKGVLLAEKKRLARERKAAGIEKMKRTGGQYGITKKYQNPIRLIFIHIKGKTRIERCFKYETATGYHCLTYQDKADVRTLWLRDTDWFIKEKKPTPEQMIKDHPLPKMTPESAAVAVKPEPAPKPPKVEPTECYPIEEMRQNEKAFYRDFQTVGANAEANFATDQARMKIEKMRHAAQVRTTGNSVSAATPIVAEWE